MKTKRYEERSNPFDKFWVEEIDETDPLANIPVWEFSKELNQWLEQNKFRSMSDKTIAKKLKERAIEQIKPYKEWYENETAVRRQVRCWNGVKWKK